MNEQHHTPIYSTLHNGQDKEAIRRARVKLGIGRVALLIVAILTLLGYAMTYGKVKNDYLNLCSGIAYVLLYLLSRKQAYSSLLASAFLMGGVLAFNFLTVVTNVPLKTLNSKYFLILYMAVIAFRAILLILVIVGIKGAKRWEELTRGEYH